MSDGASKRSDKELTHLLIKKGLSWAEAREAIGVIVEEREMADQQGYIRGYNRGYNKGYEDSERKSLNNNKGCK